RLPARRADLDTAQRASLHNQEARFRAGVGFLDAIFPAAGCSDGDGGRPSMQNRSWKELAYSVGASLALALAVVAGLMIENPYEVALRDTVRPLLVLAGVAIIGTFLAGLVHRRLMPIFAAALYAFFQYAPLRELIPYDRWDGVMTVAILALALCGLFLALRQLDRFRAA